MDTFNHKEFDDHQQILFCQDRKTHLNAIIAIHSTLLGPAVGGCRMYNYASYEDALTDVLRLSKGMSYKSALAGLPLGGGKSVIIGDPKQYKTSELLQAFAGFVETLHGVYYTAEDVGVGVDDIAIMADSTEYVCGLESSTGDPSPITACGVLHAMQAAVNYQLDRDDLSGIKVAVQGLGHVGMHLCQYLSEAGAQLIVTDIDPNFVNYAVKTYGAKAVAPDEIYQQSVDIFSPCAMGAVINAASIKQLQAKIIVGSANNQLSELKYGDLLHQQDVLYVPDYIANAGGLLCAAGDIFHYDHKTCMCRTKNIYQTVSQLLQLAQEQQQPPYLLADKMACEKLYHAKHTATVDNKINDSRSNIDPMDEGWDDAPHFPGTPIFS